jgi:hypothetical protein
MGKRAIPKGEVGKRPSREDIATGFCGSGLEMTTGNLQVLNRANASPNHYGNRGRAKGAVENLVITGRLNVDATLQMVGNKASTKTERTVGNAIAIGPVGSRGRSLELQLAL